MQFRAVVFRRRLDLNMAKDDLLAQTKDFGVAIPPTEPEQLFTMIGKEKVAIVRNPEIKETPETLIHHHNDLDQPGIDITSGLAGTSITSAANNDLLAYDTPSGLWINQTAVGAAVVPEGGTTTSLTLVQPTIGTMSATGGTATNLILVTPTISTHVLKAGDTMTGYLTLSGAPTVDLHAATKKYVDDILVYNLDGGMSNTNFGGVGLSPMDGGNSTSF